MRTISLSSRRTAMGAAATLSLAAVTVAGIAMAPMASAVAAPITLNASSGPTGGGNALIATTATNAFIATSGVEFQYKTSASSVCTATYAAAVAQGTNDGTGIVEANVPAPHVVSAKKIAFTVPALTVSPAAVNATSASWLLCIYSTSNTALNTPTASTPMGVLSASATYTIAAPPTITTISPTTGPSLGGGTLTLVGTNFVTGTTVKIGAITLTGVVVAADGLSLTAAIPPQASGAMGVTVTNSRGTVTTASGYTYTYGITVSPNTTPTNTAATDVDVQGVGFTGLTFTTTDGTGPDTIGAHVYLVDGAYDPATSGSKTKAELGECLNVLVISDNELICTVDTHNPYGLSALSAIPNGTYTVTVVSNGLPAIRVSDVNYKASIVSSGSTFTVAPY